MKKNSCQKHPFPLMKIDVKPLFLRKKNCLDSFRIEATINGVKIPAMASFNDKNNVRIAFYDGEWYTTIFETFAPGAKGNERERAKNHVQRSLTKAVTQQIAPIIKGLEIYFSDCAWGGQFFDAPTNHPHFETEQALEDATSFRKYLWSNAPTTIFTYLLTLRGDDILHEIKAHISTYSELVNNNRALFEKVLGKYVKNKNRRHQIESALKSAHF